MFYKEKGKVKKKVRRENGVGNEWKEKNDSKY
jgi:hypothetical protein